MGVNGLCDDVDPVTKVASDGSVWGGTRHIISRQTCSIDKGNSYLNLKSIGLYIKIRYAKAQYDSETRQTLYESQRSIHFFPIFSMNHQPKNSKELSSTERIRYAEVGRE